MRVAIFTDYSVPHIGGVETSIYHQQRALRKAGHEVFVISPPMKGGFTVDDNKENVVRVKNPINIHYDGMGVYLYTRDVFQKIDAVKPDIIHFESEFNMASLAVRYAKSRDLPIFYTAHTFITPQIEYLMKYPRLMAQLAVIGQKLFLGKLRPKKNYEPVDGLFGIPCKTPAEKIILNVWMKVAGLADYIVAPSQRMVDYIGHYHPDKPRFLAPNPFADELLDKAKVEPAHAPVKVISSFVMRPEKQPEILIEAFKLLTPEEQQKLKIDMYGGGLLLNKMRKLVKEAGVADRLVMHGSVPSAELHEAMLASDVMVSTSYGFDNQPMMFLEAIHAGCAILYCDQFLREGTEAGNSILVDPSPEGFAKGLRQAINFPTDVTYMKQKSKELAKKYTYETYAANFNKVLEDLKKKKAWDQYVS